MLQAVGPMRPWPVVVLPVARMDWHLAVTLLAWMAMIDRDPDYQYDLVLLCSTRLTPDEKQRLLDEAKSPSISVRVVIPDGVDEGGYATAPNFMIKAALEYTEREFPERPTLWMEADCVPMRAKWLQQIAEEYAACGKPFMGDHVLGVEIPHMTGNAVYAPNWRELAPSIAEAFRKPAHGWDSQCAHQTFPQSHRAKTIQQVWRPGKFSPASWRGIVKPETALFHQCKDGSLIGSLAEGLTLPAPAALEKSTYDRDFPSIARAHSLGRVEILYVTFRRDMDFLKYSLEATLKYAKGFGGVTIAVPAAERGQWDWCARQARVVYFDETIGKGMLHHEVMVCRADELCPHADAILHLDADVMPWRTFTPADVAPAGRPLLVRERYAECGARNNNRLIWQGVVEKAIGMKPEWETMVRHPQIHLRETYRFTRELVQIQNNKPFDEYVLSCKNEFPQGFAEYPTLGAVAIKYFPDSYTLVNYDHDRDARECGVAPGSFQYIYRRDRDFFVEFWSHHGIKPYEAWARNFLNGQLPAYHTK